MGDGKMGPIVMRKKRWRDAGRKCGTALMWAFVFVGWGLSAILYIQPSTKMATAAGSGGWFASDSPQNPTLQRDLGNVSAMVGDGVEEEECKRGGGQWANKAKYEPWTRPEQKQCATVEEMGDAAAGDPSAASLRLRERIRAFLDQHGAERVGSLDSDGFCHSNFVSGNFEEAGFGNSMYRFLTAAGLGFMLNRSVIVGHQRNPYLRHAEIGDERPFTSYLLYSNQTFKMQDVQRLWAEHDCAGKYKRRLVVRIDSFSPFSESSSLCHDWRKWPEPIIWFKDTTDVVPLQFFLKNQHPEMRAAAALLLGDPSDPDSRPNAFGELMHALVKPAAVLQQAVRWALEGGPDPDISLHLRMRSSRSDAAVEAAMKCVAGIAKTVPDAGRRRLRLLVVTDTPAVLPQIARIVGASMQVLHFDHELFLKESGNAGLARSWDDGQVPKSKKSDWGAMPRWVALVDFYLASRTRHAMVSAAYQRVATTYAQLIASLAAAQGLSDAKCGGGVRFYSSFHSDLLRRGLWLQSGFGHSWRPFAGSLSCQGQGDQCARTPLLSYAWWDAPWQSPTPRDLARMQELGISVLRSGAVSPTVVAHHCLSRPPLQRKLVRVQQPLGGW